VSCHKPGEKLFVVSASCALEFIERILRKTGILFKKSLKSESNQSQFASKAPNNAVLPTPCTKINSLLVAHGGKPQKHMKMMQLLKNSEIPNNSIPNHVAKTWVLVEC